MALVANKNIYIIQLFLFQPNRWTNKSLRDINHINQKYDMNTIIMKERKKEGKKQNWKKNHFPSILALHAIHKQPLERFVKCDIPNTLIQIWLSKF